MLRRLIVALVAVAIVGGAAFWVLTMPRPLEAAALPARTPDLRNGEELFWVGGCASCHAAPGAKGDDRLKLAGGAALVSPFGTFHAPNISPDRETGIGSWSTLDFVNAMKRGLAPDGSHLYPAFPYTSYQRMTVEDLVDLKAFMDTLPAVSAKNVPHELPFPFSIRRAVGLWKLIYLDGKTFAPDPAKSAAVNRGAYLVEGPGHCNECHTPRSALGGLDRALALSGAPNPTGKGRIPNITDGKGGIGSWTVDDLAASFESGFKPDFDAFGGSMVEVQENLAKLTPADRTAMAEYLKQLPPIDAAAPAAKVP